MDYIFEIKDKSGRLIRLTKDRWAHIKSDHPEMVAELENIKSAVTSPEFIKNSEYDENVRFYYRYYKDRKSHAKYLLTAIKHLNGDGFVITAFYTNKVKGL